MSSAFLCVLREETCVGGVQGGQWCSLWYSFYHLPPNHAQHAVSGVSHMWLVVVLVVMVDGGCASGLEARVTIKKQLPWDALFKLKILASQVVTYSYQAFALIDLSPALNFYSVM